MTYSYHIDLDERGEFKASVRDLDDNIIFNVLSEDDGSISIIDDGYMHHAKDVIGLTSYLQEMRIIGYNDLIKLAED